MRTAMLIEIKVPELAESVAEADLLEWQKHSGDRVRTGDKLVDIETDKVILEVFAAHSGILTQVLKSNGSTVSSGEVIAYIDAHIDSSERDDNNNNAPTPKASPAVRKLAAQQGVTLENVPHQGDRITRTDVLAATHAPSTTETRAFVSPAEDLPQPPKVEAHIAATTPSGRSEERVPMTRLRRRVAERLLQAQQQHAILTTFNEVNMYAVLETRKRYKDSFEKQHGVRLGLMSFFVTAVIAALKQFPVLNASIDGDDIIYHGYYDIGIAVSSARGLVVPVLRDVDCLSFSAIEKAIQDFGQRAKDNQLSLEDLSGGTFSITNGGIFGSMLSTPILNPPQSAILGMHNIVERPVAENGQVVIRPIMYVALSYDHRLIDGREAVRFLYTIKQALEDPVRLLLEI
jgi:2-oxoglutarate dehydrogenase E2 component (dihydrolipoamide succinyltransferase)